MQTIETISQNNLLFSGKINCLPLDPIVPSLYTHRRYGRTDDIPDILDPPLCALREAFQSKKQQNLVIRPNRGGEGSSKNQKSPKFQLGIVQN